MTTDLDALEYHVRRLGFPLLNSEEWTQDQKIRAHRICGAAPALIAEHRALLARVAELEEALGWFLTDERFVVSVGGNPNVVDRMLSQSRAALEAKP